MEIQIEWFESHFFCELCYNEDIIAFKESP